MSEDLVVQRPQGLYCPPGDFYIDPWRAVDRALITHAHSDHARRGHGHYLAAAPCAGVLRARLGQRLPLQTLAYGETLVHRGVQVSFHPAGHVLGSAQIRLAHQGQVWVVSGDYKLEADVTCAPFEPVRCDVFITESTFALPVFRWAPQQGVLADIHAWWRGHAEAGRPCILQAYALGKAQRLLAGLDDSVGPIVTHAAMDAVSEAYRQEGVSLPATRALADLDVKALSRSLILAPSLSALQGLSMASRLPPAATAFASGWMQVSKMRRAQGLDQAFVLSDHADWPGLLAAIRASGADRVIVTHGQVPALVRYLREQGHDADAFEAAA